jgi:hypothetical protein
MTTPYRSFHRGGLFKGMNGEITYSFFDKFFAFMVKIYGFHFSVSTFESNEENQQIEETVQKG